MLSKSLSGKNVRIDIAEKYCYIALLMQIIFCVKMYTVFYFSSRNISIGWPLSGLVFDPFHRFTDWLTVYGASRVHDPYVTSPSGATGPPYGYSLLYIVSLAKYFGPRHYYFYLVSIFLSLNYAIFAKAMPTGFSLKSISAYMSIVVVLYPLYFMVDRGNADIVAAVFISMYFVLSLYRFKNQELILATILSFVTSLKPSLLLFSLPMLFMLNYKNVLVFLLINLTVYLYPVFFLGEKLLYMPTLVISAQKILGDNPILFHHDLALVLSIFHINVSVKYVAISLIGACLLLLFYLRYSRAGVDKGLVVALVAEVTMLANHPSPDYRMLLLFPIYLYMSRIISENGTMTVQDKAIFIISFVLTMSFDNIPINGDLVYVSVLKFLGIVMALYYTVKLMFITTGETEPMASACNNS